MKIRLPFPPSENGLFATDFRTRRRFKTKAYQAWMAASIASICDQGLYGKKMAEGVVKVDYVLGRPDKRRRDCFNYEKAISDFLVHAGIIKDDSLIEDGRIRWGNVTGAEIEIIALDSGE